MSGLLIVIGLIWLVYQIVKEKSWNTNVYDGKELDIHQMFIDTNVNKTLGRMSDADIKRKYKNGGYVKKD